MKSYLGPAGPLAVDEAIPDAILDRLNRLRYFHTFFTCAGGHAPEYGWAHPTIAQTQAAKAGFALTSPGHHTLGVMDAEMPRDHYALYALDHPRHLWIVATFLTPAEPWWWEGVCQIVERVSVDSCSTAGVRDRGPDGPGGGTMRTLAEKLGPSLIIAASIIVAGYLIGPYTVTHPHRWTNCAAYAEWQWADVPVTPRVDKERFKWEFMDRCLTHH